MNTQILDMTMKNYLIAKGHADAEAGKLISERRTLHDKIHGDNDFMVVEDNSQEEKRLNEINQIIFSAIN